MLSTLHHSSIKVLSLKSFAAFKGIKLSFLKICGIFFPAVSIRHYGPLENYRRTEEFIVTLIVCQVVCFKGTPVKYATKQNITIFIKLSENCSKSLNQLIFVRICSFLHELWASNSP